MVGLELLLSERGDRVRRRFPPRQKGQALHGRGQNRAVRIQAGGHAPLGPTARCGGWRVTESPAGLMMRSVSMVTVMVKYRKLTWELITISPDPSRGASIANKWVIGATVGFRTFWGYKIVPILTKNAHRKASKRDLRALKCRSFETDLIKTCQVPRIVSSPEWRTGVRDKSGSTIPTTLPLGSRAAYGSASEGRCDLAGNILLFPARPEMTVQVTV